MRLAPGFDAVTRTTMIVLIRPDYGESKIHNFKLMPCGGAARERVIARAMSLANQLLNDDDDEHYNVAAPLQKSRAVTKPSPRACSFFLALARSLAAIPTAHTA